MLSFQVVIMALLGGVHRLWGPLVGVIPFTLLLELISASFPTQTVLLLGVAFLLIVYFIPHGVVGPGREICWTRRGASACVNGTLLDVVRASASTSAACVAVNDVSASRCASTRCWA